MKGRETAGLVSLALSMLLVTSFLASAAMWGLTLEKSEEWKETGDTIVHSVFAYDVDGDNTIEIVTAGQAYTGTETEAQLRIWSWNGTTLTLEKSEEWSYGSCTTTVFLSVFAADVDDDNTVEIIAVGYGANATDQNALITIWTWNGSTLTGEAAATKSPGSKFRSVYATNFTDSSLWEILVTGDDYAGGGSSGVLHLFNWNGSTFTREVSTSWQANHIVGSASVYAYDVDADTVTEILTAGYDEPSVLEKKHIELRIWNYTSNSFNLERDETWQPHPARDAEGLSVFVANVDADLVDEILVAGYAYNNTNKKHGYMRICTWTNGAFSTENDYEVHRGDEEHQYNSVFAENLNQDSYIEIVLGGKVLLNNTYNGNLTVLRWNGSSLTLLA
ncbi:MAG: hypothetical protein KAW09_07200, partial [Thermoplasmata archaeon]|nr:hypothetical protein [Thermoplasmata archaeon]